MPSKSLTTLFNDEPRKAMLKKIDKEFNGETPIAKLVLSAINQRNQFIRSIPFVNFVLDRRAGLSCKFYFAHSGLPYATFRNPRPRRDCSTWARIFRPVGACK